MSHRRFWLLGTILSSVRNRGLWAGISLAYVLTRAVIRDWAGGRRRELTHLGMAALLGAGAWLGASELLVGRIESGAAAAWATVLVGLSASAISIGLSHFTLHEAAHPQVIYRSLAGLLLTLVTAAIAWLGFDRWHALYAHDPASAMLWVLLIAVVMISFNDALAWFVRGFMFKTSTTGAENDLLALSEDGRWRASVHEAGHAIAYGLCDRIPEDAYACVAPDLLTSEGGAVGFPHPRDACDLTRERLEWMMICVEGGPAAEELVFGSRTVLGAIDVRQLNHLALSYMATGLGEVVDLEATTEPEVQANRAAIARCRERTQKTAAAFVAANRDAIERVARELMEAEFMDCKALEEAVRTVQPIPGLPRMTWPGTLPTIERAPY